jgi:hypothetical protein
MMPQFFTKKFIFLLYFLIMIRITIGIFTSLGRISSFAGILTSNGTFSTVTKDVEIKKIGETVVFSGYRNIVRRDILLPNGQQASFDIVHQKHLSVVVFVWDTISATGTLIREYHPGPEKYMYGTVAGMYEFHKHSSALEAAQHELEEEAQLQSNQWISLLQESTTQMPLDKYSNNFFLPYMALDCQTVWNPLPPDEEEFIRVYHNVTYMEMMSLIQQGKMNVVSTYTILMGFHKLKEMGISYERK